VKKIVVEIFVEETAAMQCVVMQMLAVIVAIVAIAAIVVVFLIVTG